MILSSTHSTRRNTQQNQGYASVLFNDLSQVPIWVLSYSKCSINICWINERSISVSWINFPIPWCGRQKNHSQTYSQLVLRVCEYVSWHGKRNSADMLQVRTLRWGEYPGGPNLIFFFFLTSLLEYNCFTVLC